MAKKEKFELDDDFNLDGEFDVPDMDFNFDPPKDDRKPITKFASGVLSGAKDTVLSPSTVRKVVKGALPKGYGSALDLADQTTGNLKSLYDTAAKEMKPLVNDIKRSTQKILPSIEKSLPESMSKRLRDWAATSDDKKRAAEQQESDRRESEIAASVGAVFGDIADQNQKDRAVDKAEDRIRDGLDQARHKQSMTMMGDQRMAGLRQVAFQEKIMAPYYRKSLELQFRGYYLAIDAHNEQKRINAITEKGIGEITKNTALPDYVKLQNREYLGQLMRNKFIDGIGETLWSKRRDFVNAVGKKMIARGQDKIKSTAERVRSGLGQVDSLAELAEMQKEFGGGMSGAEMGGLVAGGFIGDKMVDSGTKWVRKKIENNEGIARRGNKFQYFTENLPQIAGSWAEGTKGDDWPLLGGIVRAFKETIQDQLRAPSQALEVDNLDNLQAHSQWKNRDSKSLTEIIPGYLARILREVTSIRTGETAEMVQYDYSKNQFSTASAVKKNVFESIISDSDKRNVNAGINSLIDALDPEVDGKRKLTQKQRIALGRQLMFDNMTNREGDPERYKKSESYTRASFDDSEAFAEIFKEYFKEDSLGEKKLTFAREYNRLGEGIADRRNQAQQHVNSGNLQTLIELGIVNPNTNAVDMEKLFNLYLPNDSGGSSAPSFGGTAGTRRVSRRRGEISTPSLPNRTSGGFAMPAPAMGREHERVPVTGSAQVDSSSLASVIRDASPKSAAEEQVAILKRIEDKLNTGIAMYGAPGSVGPDGRPWSQRTLGELGSSAWRNIKHGSEWLKEKAIWGGGHAKNALGWGAEKAKAGFDWARGKYDEVRDVYIKGELVPRLLKAKLEAGQYYDQASGKVIKSYKDIAGTVVDKEGNIIITAEDVRRLFIKDSTRDKLIAKFTSLKEGAKDLFSRGVHKFGGIYGQGLLLAKQGIEKLMNLPQDVYVVGKKEPVLLAVTMRAGGYASKLTSKTIVSPRDIDGPVYDHTGNIVLSAEDLAAGLLDKYGRPLKWGLGKVIQNIRSVASWGMEKARKGFSWLKDKAAAGWEKVKGFTAKGFSLDIALGRSARTVPRLLLDIRDMLNDRLPGERTTFAPLPDPGPDLGSALKSGAGKVSSAFKNAKERLQNWWNRDDVQSKKATMSEWLSGKKSSLMDFYHRKKGDVTKENMSEWLGEKKFNLKESAREKRERMSGFLDTKKSQMAALFDKYFGKKKVLGDTDGDGEREGSAKSLMAKMKEKALAAKEAAKAKASGGLGSIGAGLAGLISKLRGKKNEEEEDEDEGDTDIDFNSGGGDSGDEKKGRRGRKRRRNRRNRKPQPPKGFWNKTKHYGGKAIKGIGSGIGKLGKFAIGGLGMGALGAIGSAAAGIGGAILSGLGAVASGILGVLATPVVLGGLAIAAVGAGAYYGYKYLTRKKLDKFNTLRYAQYGFTSTDEDHVGPVFQLEDLIAPAVTFKEGQATIDTKKVDWDEAIQLFGVEKDDENAVASWLKWFIERFKPVFLTHYHVFKSIAPDKSFGDVASLKPEQLKKYLQAVKMPDGPYGMSISPFPNGDSLKAGPQEVSVAFDEAMKEVPADTGAKSGAAAGAAGAAGLAAASAAAPSAGIDGKAVGASNAGALQGSAIAGLAAAAQAAPTENNGRGMIEKSSQEMFADAFSTNRIDALTAIRFKTYGLVEMAADKVRALALLEDYVEKDLIFQGNKATWKGSIENAVMAQGPNFGVSGGNNTAAYNWINWFSSRFLPVYLNYAGAVMLATGKSKVREGANSLKPIQAVNVATAVYTSNGVFNETQSSVWSFPLSPWPGYEMNTDVKTTEPNMKGLQEQAKRMVLDEEKSGKTGVDGKTGSTPAAGGAEQNSVWGKITNSAPANWLAKKWESAKEAIGMGEGRQIEQPGKGSGGDINSIPKPTGNGTWASVKDTILAAAKMVGVDSQLMAAMAAIESGFNWTAKAGTSSASGLYQFIDGTWKGMLKKFGGKYGIDPSTKQTDPRANALMGAEFIKENTEALKSLGRPLTDVDLYFAHFLGSAGAKKFLSASPTAIGADILPAAARANETIFYRDGRALTVGEIYQLIAHRVRNKAKQFGVGTIGSESITSASAPKGSTATDAGPKGTVSGIAPAGKSVDEGYSEKKSTPVGNFPVADQSPIPSTAPGSSADNPAGEMQVVTVTGKRPKKDGPSSPVPEGFDLSPRALNNQAQQQYQRDMAAEALMPIGETLTKSHDVLKDILTELKKTNVGITALGQKGALSAPVQPVQPEKSAPPKSSQGRTTAPVSMSKSAMFNSGWKLNGAS